MNLSPDKFITIDENKKRREYDSRLNKLFYLYGMLLVSIYTILLMK